MYKIWVGFVASGPSVVVVGADIPSDKDAPIVITYDQTWSVQRGDRPTGYDVIYQQCRPSPWL